MSFIRGPIRSRTFATTLGKRTAATSLYVKNSGSDSSSGSVNAPVQTIARAFFLAAQKVRLRGGPVTIQMLEDSPGVLTTFTSPSVIAPDDAAFLGSYVTLKGVAASSGAPNIVIQGTTDGQRLRSFMAGTRNFVMFVRDLKFQSFTTVFGFGQNATINQTSGRVDFVNNDRIISTGLQGIAVFVKGDWDGRDLDGNVIDNGIGYGGVQQSSFSFQPSSFGDLNVHHIDRAFVMCDGVAGHINRVLVTDCTTCAVDLTRSNGSPNLADLIMRRNAAGIRENTRTPPNISNAQDFGQDTTASCTAGSISGTTLTVGGTVTGTYGTSSFRIGQTISGSGVAAATILKRGTLANTWVISVSQTISTPQTINAAYQGGISASSTTVATATGVTSVTFGGTMTGTPVVGQTLYMAGVPEKVHLKSQTSANVWVLDNNDSGGAGAIADIAVGIQANTYDWCDDPVILSSSPTTAVENILQRQPRPIFHYPQLYASNLTGNQTERVLYNPFSIIPRAPRVRDVVDFDLKCNCVLSAGGTLRMYLGDWTNSANKIATITVPSTARYVLLSGGFQFNTKTDVEGKLAVKFHTATTPITGVVENINIDTSTGLGKVSQFTETAIVVTWQAGADADTFSRRRSMIHFSIAQVSDTEFDGDEDGDGPESGDDF